MVILIGGASRSGKSIVARRVTQELGISAFPLDFLIEAVRGIAPRLDLDGGHRFGEPHQPFVHRAEKLWPSTKRLLWVANLHQIPYLIEGDTVLPRQIAPVRNK